MLAKIRI